MSYTVVHLKSTRANKEWVNKEFLLIEIPHLQKNGGNRINNLNNPGGVKVSECRGTLELLRKGAGGKGEKGIELETFTIRGVEKEKGGDYPIFILGIVRTMENYSPEGNFLGTFESTIGEVHILIVGPPRP